MKSKIKEMKEFLERLIFFHSEVIGKAFIRGDKYKVIISS